jgi:hypothetical protein
MFELFSNIKEKKIRSARFRSLAKVPVFMIAFTIVRFSSMSPPTTFAQNRLLARFAIPSTRWGGCLDPEPVSRVT